MLIDKLELHSLLAKRDNIVSLLGDEKIGYVVKEALRNEMLDIEDDIKCIEKHNLIAL